MEWRQVGPAAVLRMKRCQRLRATNKRDDIALISVFDKQANCDVFYAVQAWCPHAGNDIYTYTTAINLLIFFAIKYIFDIIDFEYIVDLYTLNYNTKHVHSGPIHIKL